MKNTITLLALIISFFVVGTADAVERVESIDYQNLDKSHFFEVNYKDGKKPLAKIEFKPNVIQLSLPNTIVWPKQEKRVRPEGTKFDVSVLAYQFTKDTVRFRIVFPDNVKIDKNKVKLVNTDKGYRIVWKNDQRSAKNGKKKTYDENYLERLLSDKITKKEQKPLDSKKILDLEKKLSEDTIQTSFSATDKAGDKGNSLNDYLMKFIVVILGLGAFCVIALQLVRKGVLKQGKLNFLRNTQQIEQISSTHLSPKRSLHLVKVSGQVFFIGATDSGISLLSEIDTPGNVLKEAEKILAGDNFESNLEVASTPEVAGKSEVKIKEDITQSEADLSSKKSEFVSHLKERVRNLKSLQ